MRRDALLVYTTAASGGDADEFVALEVVGGRVRFSFALGPGGASRLRVDVDVATGAWHRVVARRDGRGGTLTVTRCSAGPDTCESCAGNDPKCFAQSDEGDFR